MSKYKLNPPSTKDRDKFIVTIVADSNDADYITGINTYAFDKFNGAVIDELIELKKNYGEPHQLENCPLGEYISIPFNGYDGFCHSLKSLEIKYVDRDGYTWNVELEVK